MTEEDCPVEGRRMRQRMTAAELAGIAGVEANTIRRIASELLDMLERDLQSSERTLHELAQA